MKKVKIKAIADKVFSSQSSQFYNILAQINISPHVFLHVPEKLPLKFMYFKLVKYCIECILYPDTFNSEAIVVISHSCKIGDILHH